MVPPTKGPQTKGVPSTPKVDEFSQIPASLFRSNDVLEWDVYLLYQGQFILYRSRGHHWKVEDLEKLSGFGLQHIFVRFDSDKLMHEFLDQKMSRIFDDPAVPISDRAKILYSATLSSVENIFAHPETPASMQRSVAFVKHCVNFLAKDRSSFYELFKFASKNFSEYSHALHVTIYAISLAKQVGYRTNQDATVIGLAALLHDIGKTKIDPKILNKTTSLTPEERAEVEKHSEYSYQLVHPHKDVSDLSKQIILQHHERISGSGYPKHMKDEIHIFSKILSICDCFDSMTSERPYQRPLKPLDAVKHMLTELKSDYEQSLLINFIRILQE